MAITPNDLKTREGVLRYPNEAATLMAQNPAGMDKPMTDGVLSTRAGVLRYPTEVAAWIKEAGQYSESKTLTIPIASQAGAVSNGVYPILLGELDGLATHGRDISILDANNQTVPHCRIEKRHIAALDGAWIFYGGPCVFFDPDASTEGEIYIGYITSDGYRNVSVFDVATGEYTVRNIDSTWIGNIDDHNQPAFCLNGDGKLVTAYCEHPGPIKVRVANTAHTLSAGFGSAIVFTVPPSPGGVTGSYTNLYRLSATNEIYLWFRETNSGNWWLSKSTNQGTSWSTPAASIDFGATHNYAVFWSDDVGRVWIAANYTRPNNYGGSTGNRGIYCFVFDGTNYLSVDNEIIGTSITDESELPEESVLFYHSDTEPIKRSVIDVIQKAGEDPKVLYYVYPDGDEAANHELWYAHWNGMEWLHYKVVDEGPAFAANPSESYPGAAQFDRSNTNRIATCVSTVSGKKEVVIYQTTDNGVTWTKIVDVTKNSIEHNTRPKYPHGMTTTLANKEKSPHLFWMGNGDYVSFTNYKHAIKAYPADYSYGALVKLDLPGNADVPLTIRWGNASSNGSESLDLFDDLGMDMANIGTMRFNDSHVTSRMVTYGADTWAKEWYLARLIQTDNTGWPSWKKNGVTAECLRFAADYTGKNQMSSLYVGKRVFNNVVQHLISNNLAGAPLSLVIMRLNNVNRLEYLIYQSSAFATVVADAGIGTDWELLAGIFNRNATIEVRQGETGKTAVTSDQSINVAGPSALPAVSQRDGTVASTYFNGPCFMSLQGITVLSKAYTDTLSRAVKTPLTFVVES